MVGYSSQSPMNLCTSHAPCILLDNPGVNDFKPLIFFDCFLVLKLLKVFTKAFESMIETQLQARQTHLYTVTVTVTTFHGLNMVRSQEQRLTQFRQKLAARRRKGQQACHFGGNSVTSCS